jgi:aspartate racemase
LGPGFRGDLDAPRVIVLSEPHLGHSMDLPATEARVWSTLTKAARQLSEQVDVYAIACNTLNVFAPRLRGLDLPARLVSYPEVVAAALVQKKVDRFVLLGAAPVASLGPTSAYSGLQDQFIIDLPPDPAEVDDIIRAVKRCGPSDPSVVSRFAAVLDSLPAETVVLACTELPLIPNPLARDLLDPTDLVAATLAAIALDPDLACLPT